jgi:hypothetical protein
VGFDLFRRFRGGPDSDPSGLLQVFIDQTTHGFFDGGREKHGLAIGHGPPEDAFYSRQEAHVEHTVCLIQHHHADGGKADQLAIEEIAQASGCCYYDAGALPKRRQLGSFGHSTHDNGGTDSGAPREKRNRLVNLDGEFTGGAENQGLNALPAGFEKRFENWKRERKGFAGTGLSGRDHIAAYQRWRDCPRLNRRGRNKFSVSQVPAKDRRANQVRKIIH